MSHFVLESIVLRHGAPSIVITNRRTAFTAQLMQIFMTLSSTSRRKTTAYHPQTNGLTERINKTIADMLCLYVDVEHKTWYTILPYVMFGYNTVQQETTRMTPLRLLYGRDVSTMLTPCRLKPQATTMNALKSSHSEPKKHGNLLACV